MRSASAWLSAIAIALLAGPSCARAPREIVLRIDTDASVPDRQLRGGFPPNAVFDRLEVALYDEGAVEPCGGCLRTFGVDAEMFRAGTVSISFPLDRGGARARVRLFWSGTTGLSRRSSTVEAVILLPHADAHSDLLLELPTASTGHPAGDLTMPGNAQPDTHPPSRVGTWHDLGVPCTESGPPGTVCVPARWYRVRSVTQSSYEQLVVLSSFFIDVHEWSAARFRRAKGQETAVADLGFVNGPRCPAEVAPDRPAACVTAKEARRLCAASGGRLPTYHELALLNGGLTGGLFPWGDDPPLCADAVVSRVMINRAPLYCSTRLLGGAPTGSVAVDVPFGRDVLALPGGTVLHLAGNVAEWAEATNVDSCHDAEPIQTDPRCPEGGVVWGDVGGAYTGPRDGGELGRLTADGLDAYADTGFRCAYDR